MFSFKLTDDFISQYNDKEVPFGFRDAGTNALGEITFIRTYSRKKDDGTKEKWHEVCERVINGMYSIQKDHCKQHRLPWNDRKAHASAQEAFDRMFNLKWTPPGRGLWMMGSKMVMENRNSAALQNCAFVSTRDIDKYDPGALFAWVMDALMLGVGVGFCFGLALGCLCLRRGGQKQVNQLGFGESHKASLRRCACLGRLGLG